MKDTLQPLMKFWQRFSFTAMVRPLVAIALVVALVFSHADSALAAMRGGGRIGGGGFRAPAPSRTYSAPRSYAPGGGGYYPGGGGFFFPFVWSPFMFGGGGLFTLLLLVVAANFVMQTVRRMRAGDSLEAETVSPMVSVAKVQVGLLAEARELQADLNKLALLANTGSATGLAQVLQETSLALLRHPEYWIYGDSSSQKARLTSAEMEFNRLALMERSKFSRETLSNVNSQLRQTGELTVAETAGALEQTDPGEYIVVTLLAGVQGDVKLPDVKDAQSLRQALQQLGGVGGDRLLALEILWTPQAEGDVLTRDDLLVEYPTLKLV